MSRPYVLHFNPGESLLDIASVSLVAGVAWGSIYIPATPLIFSDDRLNRDFSDYHRTHPNANFDELYDVCYDGNPNKDVFHGERLIKQTSIYGVCIGIGEAGILSAAGDAVEGLIGRIANTAVANITSSGAVSAGGSQSSGNPLLHGLNGNDTFYLNSMLFSNYEVCIIQGVMGALFELSMCLVLFGNFRSMGSCPTMFHYLWGVHTNSFACALVPTGSVGLVIPGAEIKLLYT